MPSRVLPRIPAATNEQVLHMTESHMPTAALVHGAFAESASWTGVIEQLDELGITVVAVANPLRDVASDARSVAAVVASIEGPVVLVGHSYGAFVVTNAAVAAPNAVGLVVVAGFAPDEGESAVELAAQFPGSTLGAALAAVPLGDGTADLFIRPEVFHSQFCADVPMATAKLMAVTQRPVRDAALGGPSGPPAWRNVPSWFVIATEDRNIPAEAQRMMAQRASAIDVIEAEGASHAIAVSQPDIVAAAIHAACKHVAS
jgi:pimeloyl-ACP methyl ester carboxylesterase